MDKAKIKEVIPKIMKELKKFLEEKGHTCIGIEINGEPEFHWCQKDECLNKDKSCCEHFYVNKPVCKHYGYSYSEEKFTCEFCQYNYCVECANIDCEWCDPYD